MKIPQFITFTGLDRRTDPDEVIRLARLFPNLTEWGVLRADREYARSGPSDEMINYLVEHGPLSFKLALHLCQGRARRFMAGDWSELGPLHFYARVQINTREHYPLATYQALAHRLGRPLIVQVHGGEFPAESAENVHYLFDPSAGRGVSPESWPAPAQTALSRAPLFQEPPVPFVGYAGGIGPHNVRTVLSQITTTSPFWIDMESNVRTDNIFDLSKVERVLRAVYAFAVSYEVEGYHGSMVSPAYSPEDIESHRRDIAGYDGVHKVKVIPTIAPEHI